MIEYCNGDKKAGSILYKWLEAEDALCDDYDDVFDYDNLLDLLDAADDRDEARIVRDAL